MRVWSPRRRKQARVTTERFCRLEPDDVVELLHDHQGRYAFKLVETTPTGHPMLEMTPLVTSMQDFVLRPAHSQQEGGNSGADDDGGGGGAAGGTTSVYGVPARPSRAAMQGRGQAMDAGQNLLHLAAWNHEGDGSASGAYAPISRDAGDPAAAATLRREVGDSNKPPAAAAAAEDDGDDGGEEEEEAGGEDGRAAEATTHAPSNALAGIDTRPQRPAMSRRRSDGSSDTGSITAGAAGGSPLTGAEEFRTGIDRLPLPALSYALQFLPLHQRFQVSRVCRGWDSAVALDGALSTISVGDYFGGVIHPPLASLDTIARRCWYSCRNMSFAQCRWLTAGHLLYFLGAPVQFAPSQFADAAAARVTVPVGGTGAHRTETMSDDDDTVAAAGSRSDIGHGKEGPRRLLWLWPQNVREGILADGGWTTEAARGWTAHQQRLLQYMGRQGDPEGLEEVFSDHLPPCHIALEWIWSIMARPMVNLWDRVSDHFEGSFNPLNADTARENWRMFRRVKWGETTSPGGLMDPQIPKGGLREAFLRSYLELETDVHLWRDAASADPPGEAVPGASGPLDKEFWDAEDRRASAHYNAFLGPSLGSIEGKTFRPGPSHQDYCVWSNNIIGFRTALQEVTGESTLPRSHVAAWLPEPAERPTPVQPPRVGETRVTGGGDEGGAGDSRREGLSPTPPLRADTFHASAKSVMEPYASPVECLDLRGCVSVLSSTLPIIVQYTPYLSMLVLEGCVQMTTRDLCECIRLLPHLEMLNVDYVEAVNDSVLEALGDHCPKLQQLFLAGAISATDAGVELLARKCPLLERLVLRGCTGVGDAGVTALAAHATALKHLSITGVQPLLPSTFVKLLERPTPLGVLVGELWEEQEVPDENGAEGATRRAFRSIHSVRGAYRGLRARLGVDDPQVQRLAQRSPFDLAEQAIRDLENADQAEEAAASEQGGKAQ